MPTANPLFLKKLYIQDKFVTEKWANHCFFVDEKNLQKFSLTRLGLD